MARPIKKGLDYFPLNVTLRGRIEYIQCMYGMLGVMVVISLWQRIYENSYYIEYHEKSALTFSKDFGTQLEILDKEGKKRSWEIFDDIVRQAVKEGIFHKELFEKFGILTSRRIQENYLKAKEKCSKIEFDERYLLLSDGKFSVSSPETEVSSPKTGVITPDNATKESKVKESKVKKSKGEGQSPATLTQEEINSLSSEFGEDKVNAYVKHFNEYCEETGKRDYYKKPAQTIRKWIIQDKGKENGKPKGANRFSNYTDTNEIDFKAHEEQIMKEMLEP